MESAERLECTQIRFLNDVLRILFVMKQPSGEVVGRIHVRQHCFFKRRQFVLLSGILFLVLLRYDKLHNLGTRLEIFSVKTILGFRSEERRVGKECRARWGWERSKNKRELYNILVTM